MPWANDSDSWTAIVFVHGVLSSNASCWWNNAIRKSWPSLVVDDPQFENAATFLAGYESGLGAGRFDVRDAAERVFNELSLPGQPLERRRLIFVCHSQGGIVVRQMLCTHASAFANKHVGLVLCGSPSWGSRYANWLAPLTRLIGHRQAYQLRKDDPVLVNLDRDFQLLISNKTIPSLKGVCLVETRGRLWRIPIKRIVWDDSASRYFPWQRINKATHGSLVKPDSITHGSHLALASFAHREGFLTRTSFRNTIGRVLEAMTTLERAYDPARRDTLQQRAAATIELRCLLRDVIALEDKKGILPMPELTRMLNAASDASGNWAFFDFDHTQFSTLVTLLQKVQASLT
jgi:Alpha/beta hydrolase family